MKVGPSDDLIADKMYTENLNIVLGQSLEDIFDQLKGNNLGDGNGTPALKRLDVDALTCQS